MPVLQPRSPTPQNGSDVEMPRAELMQDYESNYKGPIRTNTRAQRKYKPITNQLRKIGKNINWDNLSHNEDVQKITEQIRKNNEQNEETIDTTTDMPEETTEIPEETPEETADTSESPAKLDGRKQKRKYDTTIPNVVLRKESIPRKLKVVPRKTNIKWDNLNDNDQLKPEWDKVDEATKTPLPDSDEDQF